MSSYSLLNQKVDQLGNAWENFRQMNDRRLRDIEQKNVADPITVEQVDRLNKEIDLHSSKISEIDELLTKSSMENSCEMSNNYGNSAYCTKHSKKFTEYLRKGNESDLSNIEQKALSVANNIDGGYLVTANMSKHIAQNIDTISSLRQISRVETISSDSLDVIQDFEDVSGDWSVSETAIVSDTTTPQLSKKEIHTFEIYTQPKATQKLIDDANIDIEFWLANKIGENFSKIENDAFINGDGTNKPKGILQYVNGIDYDEIEQINSGTDGQADSDSLINLYYSLKADYATNAHFVMNRAVTRAVRLLTDQNKQYIWQPSFSAGEPDTLMGQPIIENIHMPVPATGALGIAVGDFSQAYTIVDRYGVRILRDNLTEKPFIKFYATKRVGGAVVNGQAIKLLKFAA